MRVEDEGYISRRRKKVGHTHVLIESQLFLMTSLFSFSKHINPWIPPFPFSSTYFKNTGSTAAAPRDRRTQQRQQTNRGNTDREQNDVAMSQQHQQQKIRGHTRKTLSIIILCYIYENTIIEGWWHVTLLQRKSVVAPPGREFFFRWSPAPVRNQKIRNTDG